MGDSREAKRGRKEVEAFKIEISAFCHATEDCSRVENAIRNVFPSSMRKNIVIDAISEEGYYGNPIKILTVKITDRNLVNEVIQYLASSLGNTEKSILKATIKLRYDDETNRLITRFSKQDLYMGSFRIVDTDDIVKVVIYFRNARASEDVVNYLKQNGLIP